MRIDDHISKFGGNPKQNYLYNGKEKIGQDIGLNWLAYGFRMYDPAIGRFPSVDPLAEKFAFVSPFNYAENEPIAGIDLWGLQRVVRTVIEQTFKFDLNPKGVKKSSGTDIITQFVTVSQPGSYSGIVSVLEIDSDGKVKDEGTVMAYSSVQGDGFSYYPPKKVSKNMLGKEFLDLAIKKGKEKENNGPSILQDRANNINLGIATTASLVVAVGTAGISAEMQAIAVASKASASVVAASGISTTTNGVISVSTGILTGAIGVVSPEGLSKNLKDEKTETSK